MSQVTDKEMLNGDTEVTYSCQHLKESYTKQKMLAQFSALKISLR